MRLWTLHPKYLDPQGLVALWREGLLAQAVLRGRTKGYRHHPQLRRFQSHTSSRGAISAYLQIVLAEADARGYAFDGRKISAPRRPIRLVATRGQLDYEWQHLLRKLRQRSPSLHRRWKGQSAPDPHPLFRIVKGDIESWEKT